MKPEENGLHIFKPRIQYPVKTDRKNDYDLPKRLKLKTTVSEDAERMVLLCIAGGNGKGNAIALEKSSF